MTAIRRNIGAFIKPEIGIAPQSVGSATTNGTGLDNSAIESATLILNVGAGTITTVDAKLQESDLIGSGFSDLLDKDGNVVAVPTVTGIDTISEVDVRLEGAKQFVRVVVTSVGTAILVDAVLVFGGQQVIPA